MLYIFHQDYGWAGCVTVVSDTEENARKLMAREANYAKRDPVERYEIKEGLVFAAIHFPNYGDL